MMAVVVRTVIMIMRMIVVMAVFAMMTVRRLRRIRAAFGVERSLDRGEPCAQILQHRLKGGIAAWREAGGEIETVP